MFSGFLRERHNDITIKTCVQIEYLPKSETRTIMKIMRTKLAKNPSYGSICMSLACVNDPGYQI